ncbi:hypothetical protein C7999DRAFT_28312 [Corynascus novoguineensis]|uniref:Uncharacterized protein n=1 Tax=Corynascus novoguineensis TaxID=1126955 RepID=A0AAN7D286_9PEZI|nr:hypothetical protein C7999DRAFT_28312 [Corynascus novoguineensis]
MAHETRDGPRHEANATSRQTRTCSPLDLIKSSLESVSRRLRSEQSGKASTNSLQKKYVHTPTHAASSFLKTTTTREMQRANEIL